VRISTGGPSEVSGISATAHSGQNSRTVFVGGRPVAHGHPYPAAGRAESEIILRLGQEIKDDRPLPEMQRLGEKIEELLGDARRRGRDNAKIA
jgi:hypothetical protein